MQTVTVLVIVNDNPENGLVFAASFGPHHHEGGGINASEGGGEPPAPSPRGIGGDSFKRYVLGYGICRKKIAKEDCRAYTASYAAWKPEKSG